MVMYGWVPVATALSSVAGTLVCVGVCMLTYADVCLRMVTYGEGW